MADSIRIKGGNGDVPKLLERELAYQKDEQALYIGTANGNVELCGAGNIASIESLIGKVTALESLTEQLSLKMNEIETRLSALDGK